MRVFSGKIPVVGTVQTWVTQPGMGCIARAHTQPLPLRTYGPVPRARYPIAASLEPGLKLLRVLSTEMHRNLTNSVQTPQIVIDSLLDHLYYLI